MLWSMNGQSHSNRLIDLYQPTLTFKKVEIVFYYLLLCIYLVPAWIRGPFIGKEALSSYYLFGRGGFGGFFISIMIQLIFFLTFVPFIFCKKKSSLMLDYEVSQLILSF